MNNVEHSSLRVPPHSIEAESSVLGSLLLNNESLDHVIDLLTDDDCNTFCAARFCEIACILNFITTTLINVLIKNPVDFSQLGVGFGAVLGGAGAFVGAKAITQKDQ